MVPKAQRESNKRWGKKHPYKMRLYSDHSASKRYIRHTKSIKHLKELMLMIKKRIKEL